MTISETARLDMLSGLRTHVGEAVANTLMEHLPPGGWYDVARTGDFDRIETRLDKLDNRIDKLEARLDDRIDKLEVRFDKLEARIDKLEARLDDRIDTLTQKIETNTRWMIGISITYGIGILGALVTFMVATLS
jgi:tetrahydromethanopterin S-methyltransferase subunit G